MCKIVPETDEKVNWFSTQHILVSTAQDQFLILSEAQA